MSVVRATILLHVGAGALWLLCSIAIAVRERAGRGLLGLQLAAALTTLLAGIALWHALHAHGMGSAERLLIVGTFCAFIALGLQAGVSGPAFSSEADGQLPERGRALYWVSLAFLVFAAAAMIGSRYVG